MCTLDHLLKAYRDPAILLSITIVSTQVYAGEIYCPEAAALPLQALVSTPHSLRKMRPDGRHLTLTGFPQPTARGVY